MSWVVLFQRKGLFQVKRSEGALALGISLRVLQVYQHCGYQIFTPNLKELSLEFSPLEDDATDLAIVVESLGRTCPMLRHIRIAFLQLPHGVVLALAEANVRNLCRLSLVYGSGIIDASVHIIALSYPGLELLDLSGSSIDDTGIGVICNELAGTLSRLLLSLCPNITSSKFGGIQFAAAELPLLEPMDCGMTICDYNPQIASEEKKVIGTAVPSFEEMKLYCTTPLECAAFGSSLCPEESLVVLDDLSRAREGFVLAPDLQLVYLVTPINADVEPDRELYYQRFMELSVLE